MTKINKIKTIIATTIVATSIGILSFTSQINLPKDVDVYDVKQEITLVGDEQTEPLPPEPISHNTKLEYEQEWGYRSLLPSALTSKKGIHIFGTDNLQYTRGSLQGGDGAGVVYENFDPNQGILEFWVRTNFASTDTNTHYILDASAAVLYWDGANTQWKATVNGINITKADTFSAGDWTYLLLTWTNKASDTLDLEVDGSSATQVTTAQTSGTPSATIYIGQNSSAANIFNGVIAGRILNNIISSNYAAGAGHTDTFTVTPDTVWMGTYSDSDTDAIFQHRGQQVSTTDADTVNMAQAVGSRSWKDNDRVAVWDGTGYKVEGLINEPVSIATTDTSLELDNLSSANLDKVGVGATLNGTTQYFSRVDNAGLSITGDLTMQGWIKTSSATQQTILVKWNHTDNKRSYALDIASNVLRLFVSDDGTNPENKTGTVAVNDGKWHFVAAVYDATADTVDFYVDGYLDRQQTFTSETGALNDNDSELRIGAIGGTAAYFFNGSLRNIQLFNDKRTTTEILTDATNPMADNSGNANNVSQWLLTDAASVVNPVDSNANANHLTLNGGTTTNYGTHSRTQQAFISKNLIADGGMEQGGIGDWSPTNATIAKNTSVVKFDTRSLSITNSGAAQGFARQTITTAAGEDYRFHGWFRTPATPNGASQLVDVDGTAALGITVTQAGATVAATWYEVDFTFEAADTSTTIDLGSGSATNAEIGYWDNVKIQKNLVNNPGMEGTAAGNTLPSGWSDTGSPDADETQTDTTTVHSGLASILLSAADANEGATQTATVVSGKYYTFSYWEKNNSQDINVVLTGAATATLDATGNNSWTKHSYTFKAASTSLVINLISGAATQTGYFDDISLIELDQDDPSTSGVTTKGDGHYPKNYLQVQPF